MQRRWFGATGMELPEVCFGTMRFAAKTPGDDALTRAGQRALEEALDLGLDVVHSSYIDRAALPPGDRMLDPGWDRAYDQLAEARPLVEAAIAEADTPTSWTSFALRFSLVDPIIASTVGINSPEQLREVLGALEGPRPDPALLPRLHQITARFRAEHGVRADGRGVPLYER